ncbi:MAG: hypothetical protein AB7V77_00015 [Candidatus Woesearchaeota archaeon]
MKQKKLNLKKTFFWILLIIFLPGAIYTLGTGKFLYFFILAGITFILMKIIEKYM